ncbi:hypothetical protein EBN88_02825 [Streptomyces triticirhizae]|uniref:Uncharacterized protein n=1 Tax=Streptomyces triticirhizae TaxID=2483353 RepID=A0A3M2MAP0_9ACTN|nr:hypothetical protein EBN88_02825 [Streptomyces triticirhizae]
MGARQGSVVPQYISIGTPVDASPASRPRSRERASSSARGAAPSAASMTAAWAGTAAAPWRMSSNASASAGGSSCRSTCSSAEAKPSTGSQEPATAGARRSGAWRATPGAVRAPIEYPQTVARSAPRSSRTAVTASTRRSRA